jgi:hypothetical protein
VFKISFTLPVACKLLQEIQDLEGKLQECLTNYQVGDPTNELTNFFMQITVHPVDYKIRQMNDAIGQLQGRLNYNSLRQDFLEYLGAFNTLPERILVDKNASTRTATPA